MQTFLPKPLYEWHHFKNGIHNSKLKKHKYMIAWINPILSLSCTHTHTYLKQHFKKNTSAFVTIIIILVFKTIKTSFYYMSYWFIICHTGQKLWGKLISTTVSRSPEKSGAVALHIIVILLYRIINVIAKAVISYSHTQTVAHARMQVHKSWASKCHDN